MAQLPSVPPQVSYQNGLLTIVAQNSSLGDILREVHRITGAAIDVPPNATDRVVAQIGPGPARDVLASLLNGSAFNYVMVGSPGDPTRLGSVMLTMKPTGPPPQPVDQPSQQQYMVNQSVMAPGQGPGGPVVQPATVDDEADAEEDDKDEDDSGDDDQGQNQAGNEVPNPQDGSQPNVGPKTPQQILEMLRQRQVQGPGQPVIPPPVPPQSSDEN